MEIFTIITGLGEMQYIKFKWNKLKGQLDIVPLSHNHTVVYIQGGKTWITFHRKKRC